jgi:hypothetical protein
VTVFNSKFNSVLHPLKISHVRNKRPCAWSSPSAIFFCLYFSLIWEQNRIFFKISDLWPQNYIITAIHPGKVHAKIEKSYQAVFEKNNFWHFQKISIRAHVKTSHSWAVSQSGYKSRNIGIRPSYIIVRQYN